MMNDKQQIIDLTHKGNSTIDYEVITFPDGQIHFRMDNSISHKYPVFVRCRIRNGNELFLLLQVLDVLNRHGMKPTVYIYYLLAARMDRVMDFGEPFSARIVLRLLKGYDAMYFFYEPHCPGLVCGELDPRCVVIGSSSVLKRDSAFRCVPDEGALQKYNASCGTLVCEKERDTHTGSLSGFRIKNPEIFEEGKDIGVIDDLCDGGGTFCGIVKELRKLRPSKITLQVTHAIQRQGIEKVAALYDEVYITNSYYDWEKEGLPANVHVKDITNLPINT